VLVDVRNPPWHNRFVADHDAEREYDGLEQQVEATLWDVADEGDLGQQTARFHQDRAREFLGSTPYESRQPCPKCGGVDGLLAEVGGQNIVRCRSCRTYIYAAPKHETGQRPRTVATARKDIKPGQQARIFERDGAACVLCHRTEQLTMGHVLSIKEAQELGEVGPFLNSDENLLTMCEACNLGLGGRSLLPRAYGLIMLRLLQATTLPRNRSDLPVIPTHGEVAVHEGIHTS